MTLERYVGERMILDVVIEEASSSFVVSKISREATHVIVTSTTRANEQYGDVFSAYRSNPDDFQFIDFRNVYNLGSNPISIKGKIKLYRLFPAKLEGEIYYVDVESEKQFEVGEKVDVMISITSESIKKPIKVSKITVTITTQNSQDIPVEYLYYKVGKEETRYPIPPLHNNQFVIFIPQGLRLRFNSLEHTNINIKISDREVR